MSCARETRALFTRAQAHRTPPYSHRNTTTRRFQSTQPTKLPGNPHIYVFPSQGSHLLTLLPTTPPTPSLALGYTSTLPPTPSTFRENPAIYPVLNAVLAESATQDPVIRAQAALFASQAGSSLGSGGMFFPQNHPSQQQQRRRGERRRGVQTTGSSDGAGDGGASAQGGMGGAGKGGWVHVSDIRNPPDYGRIAWPEDIFGSVEVDGRGEFVDGHGNFQASGSYRMVTNEGVFGLPDFLRGKLVARLLEFEKQLKSK